MQGESPHREREFGLDLIRACAIVLVLLAHTIPDNTALPFIGALRDMGGVWGVEIFFVLSGYLIGGILIDEFFGGRLNTNEGLFGFWKRRWFRTLPNYFLFLGIYLVTYRVTFGHSPAGWEKFLFFGQALLAPHPTVFIIAWSLAIEEWFYLLFPFLLLIVAKYAVNRRRAVLITTVIFLVGPLVLRMFMVTDDWITGVRMMTLPRLDAIGYGVALVFLKRFYFPAWKFLEKWWPAALAISLALFAQASVQTCYFGPLNASLIFYRVFYFCLISVSVVILFPWAAKLNPRPSAWTIAVRKISLWSYSLYLSHVFCVHLAGAGFKLLGIEAREWNWASGIKFLTEWAVAFAFSAAVYQCCEKPFMDLRDRTGKT